MAPATTTHASSHALDISCQEHTCFLLQAFESHFDIVRGNSSQLNSKHLVILADHVRHLSLLLLSGPYDYMALLINPPII